METATPCRRSSALAYGNQIRLEKAAVKRSLKAGELTLASALEHRAVQRAAIDELIRALPGFDEINTWRVLLEAGLPAHRKVERITPRQRALIDALVERRSRGWQRRRSKAYASR